MKNKPNPVTQARVSTRSAQDAERRAAVANRELLRWEVAHEKNPRIPRLAQEWADDPFAAHQAAQREAHRVMDTIDAMRPAGAGPETRALQIEEQTQPMDAVIEEIRLQPDRRFDPHTLATAQRIVSVLGQALTFMAGLAIGKAFS